MIKSVSKCSRPGGASLRIQPLSARATSCGPPFWAGRLDDRAKSNSVASARCFFVTGFSRFTGFKIPNPANLENPEIMRSEEHTSELQSQSNLVCRLLLEKKKHKNTKKYEIHN